MNRATDVRSTPEADMCGATRDVRFVPIADILHAITYRRVCYFAHNLSRLARAEPISWASFESGSISSSLPINAT
jgi:hypothetical protein